MSSWHPNDLVTDADLRAYESQILQSFAVPDWTEKRSRALEDWLFPILAAQGFDPQRLRTRVTADAAYGYTGSAYTAVTAATQSATDDDLNLAATFATPGTDALYIGCAAPYRGLSFRLLDAVSSVAGLVTVAYWGGAWKAVSVQDRTQAVNGKSFSGGGSVTWTLPGDWMVRPVNGSASLYYAKVTVSAVPTGATCGQIGCVRASRLRGPATLRTLELIFREAPTSAEGPWQAKADFYGAEAQRAIERALPLIGGEFDTVPDDLLDQGEQQQTIEAAGGGWRLERG
jgi:hypothetical protein